MPQRYATNPKRPPPQRRILELYDAIDRPAGSRQEMVGGKWVWTGTPEHTSALEAKRKDILRNLERLPRPLPMVPIGAGISMPSPSGPAPYGRFETTTRPMPGGEMGARAAAGRTIEAIDRDIAAGRAAQAAVQPVAYNPLEQRQILNVLRQTRDDDAFYRQAREFLARGGRLPAEMQLRYDAIETPEAKEQRALDRHEALARITAKVQAEVQAGKADTAQKSAIGALTWLNQNLKEFGIDGIKDGTENQPDEDELRTIRAIQNYLRYVQSDEGRANAVDTLDAANKLVDAHVSGKVSQQRRMEWQQEQAQKREQVAIEKQEAQRQKETRRARDVAEVADATNEVNWTREDYNKIESQLAAAEKVLDQAKKDYAEEAKNVTPETAAYKDLSGFVSRRDAAQKKVDDLEKQRVSAEKARNAARQRLTDIRRRAYAPEPEPAPEAPAPAATQPSTRPTTQPSTQPAAQPAIPTSTSIVATVGKHILGGLMPAAPTTQPAPTNQQKQAALGRIRAGEDPTAVLGALPAGTFTRDELVALWKELHAKGIKP